ncbi:MAG: MATE family efflux transporter [Eubacteriales bacterium]
MKQNLAEGKLIPTLLKFTFPIMAALFLQVAYGAVDLLIVGQYGTVGDVSGVTIGSQMMQTITNICTGVAMGTTILLGQAIGSNKSEEGGKVMGASIALFGLIAGVLTITLIVLNGTLVSAMQTPVESIEQTSSYLLICSIGTIFIIAYNVLGSIFRGIGDSKTPLIAVGIAFICNVIGDILLVAIFKMGATGAAIATVSAQAISVFISLLLIRKKTLPFAFHVSYIRWHMDYIHKILVLGVPIGLQSGLVSISFLAITAIVNGMGVIVSAGVGVTEKIMGFIMLVSSSFMQSLSAFVAQSHGAGNYKRSKQAMYYSIGISFTISLFMSYLCAFQGALLTSIFVTDADVAAASIMYLKAYAFDTIFVTVMFCMTGYFNGIGKTNFVMVQGVVGAFCVRIPMAFFISRIPGATLFMVGLATPASTILQIIMCIAYYQYLKKQDRMKLNLN